MSKDLLIKTIAINILMLLNCTSFATPLNVSPTPGTSLPTALLSGGGSVNGYYTVANNTGGARVNNYVAYLPPNVSQITSDTNISDLCAPRFSLQPKGATGSSCTLELSLSGSVNGSDQNQFNHLFVCLSDTTTCTGTAYGLNAAVTTAVAVGSYTNNSNQIIPLLMVSGANPTASWNFIDVTSISGIPSFSTAPSILDAASCSANVCVAGGYFTNSASNASLPLLLVSQNQGATWSYVNSASIQGLPTLSSQSQAQNQIFAASCSGSICTAAGIFQSAVNQTVLPLLLTSQDAGSTWSFVNASNIVNYPAYTQIGNGFYGTACNNNTCVATGSYATGSSTGAGRVNRSNNPLLVVSNDGGITWSFINVTTIAGMPTFGDFNVLKAASCNNNGYCVAVGSYQVPGTTNYIPLIIASTNNGRSWTYIDPNTIANIPPSPHFIGDTKLTNVSCNPQNSTCVASGHYALLSSSQVLQPLLLVSQNNGQSWTFIDTATLPGAPTYGMNNFLEGGVSCSGNSCAVAGTYSTRASPAVYYPLLIQSNNSGQSWSTTNTMSAQHVPAYGNINQFDGVSCSGTNVCATAGFYGNSDNPLPLILLTNAANNNLAGSAWNFLSPANITAYPILVSGNVMDITTF